MPLWEAMAKSLKGEISSTVVALTIDGVAVDCTGDGGKAKLRVQRGETLVECQNCARAQ